MGHIQLLHGIPEEVAFGGSHGMHVGDVVKWVPQTVGQCEGARVWPGYDSPDFGGPLGTPGSDGWGVKVVTVKLSALGSPYVLCTKAQAEAHFTYQAHVLAYVAFEPPSPPPPPELPPPPATPSVRMAVAELFAAWRGLLVSIGIGTGITFSGFALYLALRLLCSRCAAIRPFERLDEDDAEGRFSLSSPDNALRSNLDGNNAGSQAHRARAARWRVPSAPPSRCHRPALLPQSYRHSRHLDHCPSPVSRFLAPRVQVIGPRRRTSSRERAQAAQASPPLHMVEVT